MTLYPAEVMLASNTSVARHDQLVADRDRPALAQFLNTRFTERYLRPVQRSDYKHGFTMMAVACLMIEAMQSFYEGPVNTRGKSSRLFERFFSRWDAFALFRPVTFEFYKHVRCGILHSAETRGGWRVRREGALVDVGSKTINATAFAASLETVLRRYTTELEQTPWGAPRWMHYLRKMEDVRRNALG